MQLSGTVSQSVSQYSVGYVRIVVYTCSCECFEFTDALTNSLLSCCVLRGDDSQKDCGKLSGLCTIVSHAYIIN